MFKSTVYSTILGFYWIFFSSWPLHECPGAMTLLPPSLPLLSLRGNHHRVCAELVGLGGTYKVADGIHEMKMYKSKQFLSLNFTVLLFSTFF